MVEQFDHLMVRQTYNNIRFEQQQKFRRQAPARAKRQRDSAQPQERVAPKEDSMTTVPKEMSSARTERETKSRDLRDWMAAVNRIGELKHINGADWDVEIGTITEMGHHRGEQSHALLFDNIKGYPKGYRVLSNTLNTTKRLAITLGMPTNYTRLDFVKNIKDRITNVHYTKPEVVTNGPVLENVLTG